MFWKKKPEPGGIVDTISKALREHDEARMLICKSHLYGKLAELARENIDARLREKLEKI